MSMLTTLVYNYGMYIPMFLHTLLIYVDTGCQPENDTVWGIEWQFTAAGSVAEGKCPGLSESSGNVPN